MKRSRCRNHRSWEAGAAPGEMAAALWRWLRPVGAGCALLCAVAIASPAAAQSLMERPPNLLGTSMADAGTLQFNFLHRFEATPEPTRKVINYPTFLLGAALPGATMLGARYATNSTLVGSFPNEWEFFGRYRPLAQDQGAPVDAALHAGYNHAADSFDGEVSLARDFGRVRLLASGRGFSSFRRTDESRWALAGGATVQLLDWLALAGDLGTLLDRRDDEDVAWGAGVHLRIPYTPHTLSLQAANTNTTTLQGASLGKTGEPIWGFEFTVPFTLSRYFGGRGGSGGSGVTDAAGTEAVVVGMTNTLTFDPATVRITVGQTVRWTNNSDVMHTVTADPEKAADADNVNLPAGAAPFDSGDLAPGESFSYTFTTAGEYTYFCIPHELAGMIGTVIVEEAT